MNETEERSVMIVGGGIVGIACAHYLNQTGFRVTVIDKKVVGGACSHANCGYICPSHIPPLTEPGAFRVALKSLINPASPFRVKPSLNPALLQWMMQFAVRCNHQQVLTAGKSLQAILDSSMLEYQALMAEHQFACEWEENGLLYVFAKRAAYEEFAELDQMLTDHFGVAANRLEGAALPEFDPGLREGLYGAFHYPGDASLRPDRLNQAWIAHLTRRGVEFRENCELLDVDMNAGRVKQLRTSQGKLQADQFVFAMGALSAQWSKKLRVKIPIQPGKGYSVTLARPENSPRFPILLPEKKVGVSSFENGLRLGSMMEFVGYDATIPPARIQQLRDAARPYLVANVDGLAHETWYGWRPMTWDSLPIIGPIPKLSNSYLATGHNMIGLSLAPATGRLIAELLSGQKTHIDVKPYSVSRF